MATTRGRGSSRGRPRETSQSTVSCTNIQLPMELISDILSRLPVKSLLRFKSVSKSWYKLIKSLNFVKQNQDYFKLNPNPVFNAVLSTVFVRKTGKQIFRVNLINALDKPIDLDVSFISDDTSFLVLGICDGLVSVMLRDKSSDIVICNPLIGDFRKIPPFQIFPQEKEYEDYSYFGFGLNGDKGYELFKMVYKYIPDDDELILKGGAYSLTANRWREINVKRGDFEYLENHYKSCIPNGLMPVFLHGVFYWEATDCDEEFVVCFDVESEVFDEFDVPSSGATWQLRDINEELAVVIYEQDVAFDIWIWDEEDRSWARKYLVEDAGSMARVLGCAGNGKLVVEDSYEEESELFLYDMDTYEMETLPYVNIGANRMLLLYTESLVSVNIGDDVACVI